MNDPYDAEDRGLSTEQIAAAGSWTGRGDVPVLAGDEGLDDDYADDADYADDGRDRLTAGHATSGPADRGARDAAGEGSAAGGPGPRASLLADGELQSMTVRWKDIQAEFVDEPSRAVQQADALVAELMQRLAAMFASERAGLEERLAGDRQVSTEDLRQGLRLYRSFFERLLAA